MSIREIDELIEVDSPAWPEILELAQAAGATVLPIDPELGRLSLWRLQVTARSYLGAMALNCGGIVADHGWFRLYGGGGQLPDLAAFNGLLDPVNPPAPQGYLEIGTDALGGRFAIDGGRLGIEPGEVCYFGPDNLAWEGLGGGHSAFVTAVLAGDFSDAFEDLRWPGWQAEVEALALDEGISLFPMPFTTPGRDLSQVSRRPISIQELHELYADFGGQLDG